jgi:hypothetical protein
VQSTRSVEGLGGGRGAAGPSPSGTPRQQLSLQHPSQQPTGRTPLQQQQQAAAAAQQQALARDGPLSELLASLQLGGHSPMPVSRSSELMQQQPSYKSTGGGAGAPENGGRATSASSGLDPGAGLGNRGSGGGGADRRLSSAGGGREERGGGGGGSGGHSSGAMEVLGLQVEQLRAELGSERRESQRLKVRHSL